MNNNKFIKELLLPVVLFVLFFIVQAFGRLDEIGLFVSILIVLIVTWYQKYKHHELVLFIVGLLFGVFIEIGLRKLGFQQVWNNASFYGVPYWLPLAWGTGFIFITRIGILVRSGLKKD